MGWKIENLDTAVPGLLQSKKQLYQGRLACPIGAYDRHELPPANGKGCIFPNHIVPESDSQIIRGDDWVYFIRRFS
jgi:hypothetical protein